MKKIQKIYNKLLNNKRIQRNTKTYSSTLKNMTSNNFNTYEHYDSKEVTTPVIGGKNNNKNLKDILEHPNQGFETKNSYSPELIRKKIEDVDKLIGIDIIYFWKKTYKNSQIINLEELSKIQHSQGQVRYKISKSKSKTDKQKVIQFNLNDEIINNINKIKIKNKI